MTIKQFLNNAFPTCIFTIEDDEYASINWDSKNPYPLPSKEYILEWIARNAFNYRALRAEKYPSIGDQLDMIFHAGLGGDEFQAAIQAVKDAYPKPE